MTANPCIQDVSFPACESSHVGKLCLQLNCNSDCIHVLRSMVAVMTARTAMTELQSNRVAIAVDELFANISAHAYGGHPGRVEIETSIQVNECHKNEQHKNDQKSLQLLFDFRDYAAIGWAGNIEATAASEPDLEHLCPGGLGLRLICSVADHCSHEVLADGNHWRLIFNITDGGQNGRNA